MFAADDNSNAHQGELDVRTHAHLEERNLWFIVTVPNIVHPYP
jgi:hypothetical protein